ncbi:hypothetical protein [Xanthobacter sp. VNH20]|uniref:hypothetical protein n=1 Tax=Xanthobacter sp. VNH20 TaxID=3156616 RepID=UPI0032B435BA
MNTLTKTLSAALIGLLGATGIASAQPASYAAAAAAHERQVSEPQQDASQGATATYSTDAYSLQRGTAQDHDPHWGPAQDADQY